MDKAGAVLVAFTSSRPAKGKGEALKDRSGSLSIEELANLCDRAIESLQRRVAARQAELEPEMEKLSQYGKPARKQPTAAPVARAKKNDDKNDEAEDLIANAA